MHATRLHATCFLWVPCMCSVCCALQFVLLLSCSYIFLSSWCLATLLTPAKHMSSVVYNIVLSAIFEFCVLQCTTIQRLHASDSMTSSLLCSVFLWFLCMPSCWSPMYCASILCVLHIMCCMSGSLLTQSHLLWVAFMTLSFGLCLLQLNYFTIQLHADRNRVEPPSSLQLVCGNKSIVLSSHVGYHGWVQALVGYVIFRQHRRH